MPRTLDEIIEGYQSVRDMVAPTPLPPTAMLATMPMGMTPTMATPPGGMGVMGTPTMPMPYYNQQDLVRRAMPTMPPAMPMSNPAMMGMQYQTPIPQVMGPQMPTMPAAQPMPILRAPAGGAFADQRMQQALGLTAGLTDPERAGEALSQQWGERVGAWGSAIGGIVGGFTPLGPLAGGLIGDFLGGALVNNPLTRGIYRWWNRNMIQQISRGAQLQQGLIGNVQLVGSDAAFGGTGLGMLGATRLGQRFQTMGANWARAERMYGRDASSEDAQQYSQDLRRIAVEAGGMGLLDAATNIDQIAETTSKLMKVLGRMAKITGDPDFRNNMREIATLRQMGFSIDQALSATQTMAAYARAAGVSRTDIMSQGGVLGMGAFQQAGLASGVGLLYGAAAQATARQMMGTMTPIQEMLMGGQQGVQQRLVQTQAMFAGGPMMNAMLGATMGLGAGNQITLDPGRLRQILAGGMDFSRIAGAAQTNLMTIANTIAQRSGRSVQDVMAELMTRLPEMQSEIAQTLGPEGMMNLQLAAVGNLSKQFGTTTAAYLVGGAEGGQTLLRQLHPTALARRREALQDQLAELRGRAADEAAARAEDLRSRRAELRIDEMDARLRGFGSGYEYRLHRAARGAEGTRDADIKARDLAREQDEARGIRGRIYLTATQQALLPNRAVMEEFAGQERERRRRAGLVDLGAPGMTDFGRARAYLEERIATGRERMTDDLMEALQDATGQRETGLGRIASWVQRQDVMFASGMVPSFGLDEATQARYRTALVGAKTLTLVAGGVRALRVAEAVARTKDKTALDIMRRSGAIVSGLKRRGTPEGEAEGTVAAIRSRVLAKAHEMGRDGVFDMDALLAVAANELGKAPGMSPREAQRVIEQNRGAWEEYLVGAVRTMGSDEAKSAVTSKAIYGEKLLTTKREDLEKQLEHAERGVALMVQQQGWLGSAGASRVMMEGLGEGEREAVQALLGAESPEDARALAVYAAAVGGGSEEARAAAQSEMYRMSQTSAGQKALSKAEARYEKWRGAENLEALGVVERAAQKTFEATGGFDISKTTAARVQRAFAGKLQEAMAYGFKLEGGKLVPQARATAGAAPETEEEVKRKEAELRGLEELQEQFAAFGKASIAFSGVVDKLDRVLSKHDPWWLVGG